MYSQQEPQEILGCAGSAELEVLEGVDDILSSPGPVLHAPNAANAGPATPVQGAMTLPNVLSDHGSADFRGFGQGMANLDSSRLSGTQAAAQPAPSRWQSSLAATHSRLLWAHQRLKTGSGAAMTSVEAVRSGESLQQLPQIAWQWVESMQLTRPRTLAAAATGGIVGGLVAGPIGFGIGEELF